MQWALCSALYRLRFRCSHVDSPHSVSTSFYADFCCCYIRWALVACVTELVPMHRLMHASITRMCALLKFILQFDWHFRKVSSFSFMLSRSLHQLYPSPSPSLIARHHLFDFLHIQWFAAAVCRMVIYLVYFIRIYPFHMPIFIEMAGCYGSHFINRKVVAIAQRFTPFDSFVRLRWKKEKSFMKDCNRKRK